MLANRTIQAASGGGLYQIQKSLRFRSLASAYIARTFSTGNRRTWTLSFWYKRGSLTIAQGFLDRYTNGTNFATLGISASGVPIFYDYTAGVDYGFYALLSLRDPSAWYHLVYVFDTTNATASDRMRLYINGTRVSKSVDYGDPPQNYDGYMNAEAVHYIGRYQDAGAFNDGYLAEVNFIDGQALTANNFGQIDPNTGVWSAKRYTGTYGTNGFYLDFNNATSLSAITQDKSSGSVELITNGLFLTDVSGWTLNPGVGGTPSISFVSGAARIANGSNNSVGYYQTIQTTIGQTYYVQGRLFNVSVGASNRAASIGKADNDTFNVNAVTLGSVLQSSGSGFVRTTFVATATTTYIGLFADILTSGSADFDDISVGTLGYMNNWTPTNISLTAGSTYDSMLDVPLGGGGNERGNYCTLNPLDNINAVYAGSQNGNLRGNLGTGVGTYFHGTQGIRNMKVYYECRVENVGNGTTLGVSGGENALANIAPTGVFYGFTGTKRVAGVDTSYGASYTNNDTIGVAVDGISSTVEFFKNNVSQGVITDSLISNNVLFPYHWNNSSSGLSVVDFNFGQQPFLYTPPTGFKALHTGNLPAPTIKKPNQYFDTTLYTGNGSTQSIVNSSSMLPDLVWLKNRSGSENNQLFDSVRGVNNSLYSNLTNAEGADPGVSAFNTNGFTIGGTSNTNAASYVAWQWKRGTIPGFDIVTYIHTNPTPDTISHNLGVVPAMVIIKDRTPAGNNWSVYHKSLTPGYDIFLNTTSAEQASGRISAVTSNTFTTTGGAASSTIIAYLFAEVTGFSKIGSYPGNGSTEGPFVYCGFRPKYIMIKKSTGGVNANTGWVIFDSERNTTNVAQNIVRADLADAESSGYLMDFTANGFKLRVSTIEINNASGDQHIFIAFAEAPFKNALAR